MPTLDFNGASIEVNEDGFLVDPSDWNDDVALALARVAQADLAGLDKDHWAVINFMRSFYDEHELAPMIRVLCRKTRLKLKTIYALFPAGPAKGACKVAGLPNADGCI